MLVVLVPQILERLHVLNLVEYLAKVLHDIRAQELDVLELDELEELEDGRLQEVVASVVADEGLDDWCKKISLDDVSAKFRFQIRLKCAWDCRHFN